MPVQGRQEEGRWVSVLLPFFDNSGIFLRSHEKDERDPLGTREHVHMWISVGPTVCIG